VSASWRIRRRPGRRRPRADAANPPSRRSRRARPWNAPRRVSEATPVPVAPPPRRPRSPVRRASRRAGLSPRRSAARPARKTRCPSRVRPPARNDAREALREECAMSNLARLARRRRVRAHPVGPSWGGDPPYPLDYPAWSFIQRSPCRAGARRPAATARQRRRRDLRGAGDVILWPAFGRIEGPGPRVRVLEHDPAAGLGERRSPSARRRARATHSGRGRGRTSPARARWRTDPDRATFPRASSVAARPDA
jgi:hypothetical protein